MARRGRRVPDSGGFSVDRLNKRAAGGDPLAPKQATAVTKA